MEPGGFRILNFIYIRNPSAKSPFRSTQACFSLPPPRLPQTRTETQETVAVGTTIADRPGPPIPLSTLRFTPYDAPCKTRGQDGFATLLSCRTLSFPTTRRFIPTLSGCAVIQALLTIRGVSQRGSPEHGLFPPETAWRTLEMCLSKNSWGASPDFKSMFIRNIRNFLKGWRWANALKHCSSRAPIPELTLVC